jgi:AcrR family transcriptional regulator/uncharacterized protein YbjT (DUF2867 family)
VARIFIAGANGKVGQALLPRLGRDGHHLVGLVRNSDVPDAHEVRRDWMRLRPDDLEIGPEDVVINLTGDINPSRREGYGPANVETAAHLARFTGGRAGQVIFMSFPGARIGSPNRYLDAKGQAEAITLKTARRAVILRTTYITGTPDHPIPSDAQLQAPPGRPARSFGTGHVRARPLLMSDVVEAICGAIACNANGAFALEGSEIMTLDQRCARGVSRPTRLPATAGPKESMARLSRIESQSRTRERLLAAARQMFVRNGYARTSLDGIAEAAGFSKGAVYSNFESKEALFLELLQAKLEGEIEAFGRLLERERPARELLAEIRRSFEARGETLDFTSVAVEFMSQTERHSAVARQCASLYAGQKKAIATLVLHLFAQAGQPPPSDPQGIAAGIVSLTLGLATQRRLSRRDGPVELWARLVHDYVAAALSQTAKGQAETEGAERLRG